MSTAKDRIVFLNGQYLPLSQAHVSVMDRGFLFGDGVYEVIPVFYGQIFRAEQHLRRLEKSLAAVEMDVAVNRNELLEICHELLARNQSAGQQHYSIYIQITRGAAEQREHVFPVGVSPTWFMQCTPFNPVSDEKLAQGGKLITAEDIRWQWCFIKSIALLPNVLFAQHAKERGVDEVAWIRDGKVIEGCSSNVFIVKDGRLYTPPLTAQMLGGVTRDLVLELAATHQLPSEEKVLTLGELLQADEVWMTGSLKELLPIIQVDEHSIGDGQVGPVWKKMKVWYEDFKRNWKN